MASQSKPDPSARRGVVAFGIAMVGSLVTALVAVWVSSGYLTRLYPHDHRDGVGAIAAGMIALPVAWIVLFFAAKWAMGWIARKDAA